MQEDARVITPRLISRPFARAITAPVSRHSWALAGLLAAGSAALVLSLSAWAGPSEGGPGMHGGDRPHMMAGMHGGDDMGMGMMGHGGLPFGSGRHLDRWLDQIDATPAQRDQIKPILEKSAADLKALHEEGRKLHEEGLKLWAQPKLDAAAAEKLRKQMLTHHDKCSKRMMQTMLDVGNVLTPEQRAKVAEHMQKRHERMMDRMKERMEHMREHRRHGGPAEAASAPPPVKPAQPATKE
ncbi:MAG: Spy/CpxP family protein refolding chaperone [Aquabacterium sp.]